MSEDKDIKFTFSEKTLGRYGLEIAAFYAMLNAYSDEENFIYFSDDEFKEKFYLSSSPLNKRLIKMEDLGLIKRETINYQRGRIRIIKVLPLPDTL